MGAFAYDVSSRGGGGFEMLTVADEGGGGFEPCCMYTWKLLFQINFINNKTFIR